MSSFIMSKSEVVVLLNLIGALSIPVGIKVLTEVDEMEYQRIVDSFLASGLIDKKGETVRPDKGLEQFLLPMVKAKAIMIFNYGVDNSCTFNASLYFAESGLVALLENNNDTIKFLTLDSIDELLLFIPDITETDGYSSEESEQYISYVLLNERESIVHCTEINLEKGIARIVEGKRRRNAAPLETENETEILEYREMLHHKLKEIYNVVGC